MADDLFTVLEGLQVDEEDIREAEIFAVNFLQPLYPSLDLREGTGLRDTSIRASATLLALLRKGLTYYFTVNSLDNATNQTPEEVVDSILSNRFLTRKEGSTSILTARLSFSIRKNVTVTPSLFFSPDNERFYTPTQTTSVTADNLSLDSNTGLYYVDIDLESESPGDDYNIENGQLLFFSTFDPFFVGAEILLLKQRSIPKETNLQFIERAESSVSTRNLINSPSVDSRIRETFNFFSNITTVGMGEDEMLRDLITVRAGNPPRFVQIHNGGHIDVYVSSQIETIEEEFDIDGSIEGVLLEGSYGGVFDIQAVSLTDINDTVISLPNFEYEIHLNNYTALGQPTEPMYDLGLSAKQQVTVKFKQAGGSFDPSWSGGRVVLRMKRPVGLNSLQSFFDDSDERVACADLLARSYEVYALNIDITTHTGTSVSVFDADLYCRNYVESLSAGDPFVVSELMEILSRDAGIQNIVTPVSISYTLNKKNLEKETGSFTSILSPTRLQRFLVDNVTLNGESL